MSKKGPNPIDKHVGARVRSRRLLLGMSQEKLGDALGLTFQQVQKYEKGVNRIGASRMQHLSEILKVPIAFFYEGVPAAGARSSQIIVDDVGVSPALLDNFLATRDGLAIAKAFDRMDPKIRRRFVALAEELSA